MNYLKANPLIPVIVIAAICVEAQWLWSSDDRAGDAPFAIGVVILAAAAAAILNWLIDWVRK